ncbi:phototropic-responsive NPH3 family protein isoform X2 [Wolffia australiana]
MRKSKSHLRRFFEMDLPSDITVNVDAEIFHLHKFPLLSRCGKLASMLEISEERQGKTAIVELVACPGGSESFLLVAKFCYGLRIELTANNIFPVYCAAEHLGMTDDFGEENLISKASAFFNRVVLRDWKRCLLSLQSSDLATERVGALRIVDKALCSLSVMACTDLSLFGWPMMMYGHKQSPGGSILWNGIATGAAMKGEVSDWWFEDVSRLSAPLFCRLVEIMKARGMEPGDISGAVIHYARKHIPGLDRWLFGSAGVETKKRFKLSSVDHRGLVEGLVRLLPESKEKSVCNFLLGLLRMAMILGVGQKCRESLERRIGEQLDLATMEGLMIPSFSADSDSLYDTDCVERIIKHYLSAAVVSRTAAASLTPSSSASAARVSKMVDGYLAEVASDESMGPKKMRALAEAFPVSLRPFQDGLYRALDIYLEAHPSLTTSERERLLDVLDLSRLSTDAYRHASQNERLPMRVTLRVLFFEQQHLRTALSSRQRVATDAGSNAESQEEIEVRQAVPAGRWVSLVRESHSMRLDMDKMRSRVKELEQEFVNMKREVKKVGRAHGLPSSSKAPTVLGCLYHVPHSGHPPKSNSIGKSSPQLERHRNHRRKGNSPLI